MRLDSYHPTISFIFFAVVIAGSIAFRHPVFLGLSFVCSFGYSVKLGGRKALLFDLILLPLIVLWTAWYSYYTHFGVTVWGHNRYGNPMTLESVVYGAVIGVAVASVLMWLSCMHRIVTTDMIIYLFGKISPRLSLFLSILLRTVPRVKQRAKKINTAQRGLGRGIQQGNLLQRIGNWFRMVSIDVTWTIENFSDSADSMRSRGYGICGRRTAYSIYRFDNRDRSLVLFMSLCMTLLLMAILFDQVNIHYNPQIIFNRITPISYLFYLAYAVFCLTPMALQIVGEVRFARGI